MNAESRTALDVAIADTTLDLGAVCRDAGALDTAILCCFDPRSAGRHRSALAQLRSNA